MQVHEKTLLCLRKCTKKLRFSAKRSVMKKLINVVFYAKQFLHQDPEFATSRHVHNITESLMYSLLSSVVPSVCVRETTGKPLQEILSCEAFVILVETLQFYLKFTTKKEGIYCSLTNKCTFY